MAAVHVLLLAVPAQGHVPPMLKLAELISDSGLQVTFVNTENIHDRLLRSSTALQRLSHRPKFRFHTIPDGLPEDHPRPFLKFLEVLESMKARSRKAFREILAPEGGRDPDGWPPVTCIVADGLFPRQLLEVAEELGIPVMIFRTSGPASIWAFYYIPELIEKGELQLSEEVDLDELVPVPGLESFLRLRDLPNQVRNTNTVDYLIGVNENLNRAQAHILNAVEELEGEALPYLRAVCPMTYTIGPLQLLQKSITSENEISSELRFSDNSVSLWQMDKSCIGWLDSQARKSVVYVSFGSVTPMSREAFLEFWNGLIDSDRSFLWVIRPDMLDEDAEVMEIVRGKHEKACFVEWAPQEEVLSHPAVGCFLTHSGWNSTIESMIAGVPMICWPFFSDQPVNSRFVSEVWKVGVDIKGACERSIVERAVLKVMDDGEESDRIRKSAREKAELMKICTEKGGSSYTNFQKLIQHIKSFSSEPINGTTNNSCPSLELGGRGEMRMIEKARDLEEK